MDVPLRIETLTGAALRGLVPALSALRIRVFYDWPYLYEADPVDEAEYLAPYVASKRAALIVAFDGERPVGASTCLPLADEGEDILAPFVASGLDPARFFYFGESVLLPEYRGRGVGVAFFQRREAHARAVSDCAHACFCAVQRPEAHPLRPADAVPLDAFWRRRGYEPRPDLVCRMRWRDRGEAAESAKPLMFWVKALS